MLISWNSRWIIIRDSFASTCKWKWKRNGSAFSAAFNNCNAHIFCNKQFRMAAGITEYPSFFRTCNKRAKTRNHAKTYLGSDPNSLFFFLFAPSMLSASTHLFALRCAVDDGTVYIILQFAPEPDMHLLLFSSHTVNFAAYITLNQRLLSE